MARLTVLSIAYPFSRVSVDAVGGAEQVLGTLDAALVAAGHRSLVIAREGSQTAGALVPIRGSGGVLDGPAVGRVHAQVIEATTRVLAEEHVDVVHTHGLDVDRYLPLSGPPALVTLHLPPSWYARDALWAVRPNMHLCCVSKSQRAALPSWASRADVIENGVRIDELMPRATKARFCLVLARICPEKGIDEALDAADEAGVPLVIAGDVSSWPAHQEYFAKFIADRLRPPHRWIGPVGLARKRRLLAAARALLVPSRAPETSSLVAMEALASGTPVIAYAAGALPDIVEHGVTGYVVDGKHAMAKAIADVASIAPDACRQAAVARFSAERMASSYIAKYEELARTTRTGGTLRPEAPLVVEEVRGARALGALAPEWSELWRRSPVASPFQSSGWLLAYSDAFCGPHTNAEPWAIAVRKAGKLVALAPLCTRTRDGARTITLLGDGVSDYLDLVTDPELSAPCAAAVIETLRQHCAEDATVILDELRECSPLLASPPSAPAESEPDETFRRSRCPTLRLAAGVDPIPRAMRDKVRYYERRAERRGRVEICEVAGDACAEWLETLFELHHARWSARGEPGVLGDPDVESFQRAAVGALAKEGLCRMYGLRIGQKRAAAMLVLRDAWAAYYYIGGFDPDLAAVSPGTILIAHVVDRALAEGLAELHFLRGGEAYKYRFGARDRFNHARVLKPLPPASRRTPLPPPPATARRSIRMEAARNGAFPGEPRM